MNMKKSKKQIVKTLAALTDAEILIAGLDPLTHRKLKENPPGADETMGDIGIGPTNLDTVVRSWINRDFRKPRGKPPLASGAIKSSTKWSKLLDLCK
jgi:hypothetical protein